MTKKAPVWDLGPLVVPQHTEVSAQLEHEILALAKRCPGLSFVEIKRELPLSNGAYSMHLPNYPNILLWTGLSEDVVAALSNLLHAKQLEARSTSVFTYFADGATLQLPIVKRMPKPTSSTLRWLPICFYACPEAKA